MTIKTAGMAPLIQVFDMKTSVAFYCGKLGFTLVQRSQEGEDHFDWCMLENCGTYLMLNTAYELHARPRPTPPETATTPTSRSISAAPTSTPPAARSRLPA